ncbi:MAG: DUF3881 family protein [Pyrinomonadaceae bacterium]|jgi:hypothetical protein|nr:DUF3881 family protein [Pyrinomonadaceae bacterium]
MEIAFTAIGLDVLNETHYDNLIADVESRGEVSRLPRSQGVLHGKCLKLGLGLEVWTVLYESNSGDIFFADCRPGFRAKYQQKISPWIMTEYTENGEAVVHGFIQDSETEVLFELQNLTESGTSSLELQQLSIGLCGLAYRAEVLSTQVKHFWQQSEEIALNVLSVPASENDWSLCGEILDFQTLCNPLSGNNLYWIYIDLQSFKLEVLVNQKNLIGELKIGSFINAEVWLQGHLANETRPRSSYEGVDWRNHQTADFWKSLRKLN